MKYNLYANDFLIDKLTKSLIIYLNMQKVRLGIIPEEKLLGSKSS